MTSSSCCAIRRPRPCCSSAAATSKSRRPSPPSSLPMRLRSRSSRRVGGHMIKNLIVGAALALLLCSCGGGESAGVNELQILNVSYDPTRELYREFNEKFAAKWLADTGQRVKVQMS